MQFKIEIKARTTAEANTKSLERVLREFVTLLKSVGCTIEFSSIERTDLEKE